MSIPVVYVAAASQRPAIVDADGNVFYLPKTFNVRSEPAAKKMGLMDVAFSHGARDVSDGKFGVRIVEVGGKIWASTDVAFNVAWDALAMQIVKEDFYLQDRGRQIKIHKVQDIQIKDPTNVNYRYVEVVLQFLALDPFWYAVDGKTKLFAISSSPAPVSFDVGGNIEVYPVIIVECLANNPNFSIKNVTDLNRMLTIQDAGALSGQTVVVDCAAGTVTRGGVDKIATASGQFLRLLGGRQNQLTYTGAACNLTFQFKERWL